MAGLLDMPFEILTWIFKFLATSRGYPSRSDLRELCLAHPKLRPVAERLLYANIFLDWEPLRGPSRAPPIIILLSSFQRRPQIANYVRSVELVVGSLYDKPTQRDFWSWPSWRFGHDDIEDAPEYFKWQRFPNAKAWKDALRKGSGDAVVAYLLFTVRKSLRNLRLGINYVLESPYFVAGLFENTLYDSHLKRTWEPSFPVLRSVRIDHPSLFEQDNGQMSWKRDNFHDILPYLYLPSVEHLKLTISNASHDSSGNHSSRRCWSILEDDTSESRPMPTSLKTLELDLIREGRLGQILKVAKVANLTSLRWIWRYDTRFHDDKYMTSVVDMDQIAADLSHVSQTLQQLSIRATGHATYPDIITIKGSDLQATFPPLIALRKLEIPLVFMVGQPLDGNRYLTPWSLPKNLEHLVLTADLNEQWATTTPYLMDMVREWLLGVKPGVPLPEDRPPQAYWKPYTPNLKSVRIVLRDQDIQSSSKVWFQLDERIGAIGKLAGVEVKFVM